MQNSIFLVHNLNLLLLEQVEFLISSSKSTKVLHVHSLIQPPTSFDLYQRNVCNQNGPSSSQYLSPASPFSISNSPTTSSIFIVQKKNRIIHLAHPPPILSWPRARWGRSFWLCSHSVAVQAKLLANHAAGPAARGVGVSPFAAPKDGVAPMLGSVIGNEKYRREVQRQTGAWSTLS